MEADRGGCVTAYFVTSPLVVAKTEDGTYRYIYEGAQVPSDVTADEVKRLHEEGFLVESSGEEPKPREKWKVAELKAYAEQHSIDLGDATLKEDILAAIEDAEKQN